MNELRNLGSGRRLPHLLAALVLAALGLSACKPSDMDMGTVEIGLTDAAGDFLSYTVDVTSLRLTKADGTVVETLPQRTRVDFAQVVDLAEFVTGASIPSGNYVGAALNLDYTHADIEVDDGSGAPVQAASIVDAQNNPVTALTVNVRLDNARRLAILPLAPAVLDLDFDLAASNQVDMSNPASPVVTVSPLLMADVNPDSTKPHRIRGPLLNVNVAGGTFMLALRPFNLLQGDHGRVTFLADASTTYEINQTPFVGAAGLTALSQLTPLTATVAIGTLVPGTRQFLATEVFAGSSVSFGTRDVLTGNVIARSGNTLTVKGAALVRKDGTLLFRDTVSVSVAGTTKVVGEGQMATHNIGDISVGQRVSVFGTLGALGAMDASSGLVRLLVTQLNGVANSAGGGVVAMTLAKINGHPIASFNFAGSGTPGNDANPNSYVVATGSLPLAGIVNGTPLRVRGFVQPFGQATAGDDFNAVTLIDVTGAPATLVVGWPSLEPAPFDTFTQISMRVNLTNAGFLHDVIREGVDTRLLTTDTPTVRAANPARGLFVIGIDGAVQVYTQFGAYQQALQADLGAGRKARSFVASGVPYDDGTKTLTAGTMAAVLH
ncbi:MAG TPA: hypothetical protein VFI80_11305 [Burkholderiales bacterium]|nr:hypothetical protein [Burkholderiales bacterium]